MSKKNEFKFRLYIADDTQNSMQALANLNNFCQTYLADRHEIEVLDVFKNPLSALQDSIFMTPTLIKFSPLPVIRIVGTLNQTEVIKQTLGIGNSFS